MPDALRSARAAALAAALAGAAAAQDPARDPGLGEATFLSSCAGCHGETADGTGPMTEILTVPVPDLTRLAARNGGVFPWLRVVHVIDGTTGLRAHGGPMPVFGALFEGDAAVADAPDGTPVIASRRILAVADWLASIQAAD
ncbi:MAG: cytochrome c [Rhodobacteraceae bacterium]|nr:cytochrome c [Paracoccaceae bacterium]